MMSKGREDAALCGKILHMIQIIRDSPTDIIFPPLHHRLGHIVV
jgi:hypothetical protein